MGRRGLVKRDIAINIPPGFDLSKVYEVISKEIRTGYAEIKVVQGKLRVTLVGTQAQVKESWHRLKAAVAHLWELHRLRSAGEISVDAIAKEAGRTFPPESLVYALKLKGYEAKYEKDSNMIKTTAPPEAVISTARRIAETIDRIRFDVRGTAIKRLIASLVVGLEVSPEEVIDVGIKANVFKRDEDGKVVLVQEWRQALRKLVVLLSKGTKVLELE